MNLRHLHFIGIGGIGMSGLAALCQEKGCRVTGSDRGAELPENSRIINALRSAGIDIYPQDGSFITAGKPDALVYSTAIEEDNPDFVAGAGIPRLHRSQLLEEAISEEKFACTIAVTGSCGKSTVTAYLAEALTNLGADPDCLNGALSKRFRWGKFAGNYRAGNGGFFVFEADESDKSLVNYSPDYALILNIGTDHYSREELAAVFIEFLGKVKKGAILERGVYEAVKEKLPPNLAIAVFDETPRPDSQYAVTDYRIATRAEAIYYGGRSVEIDETGNRAVIEGYGANNMMGIYGMRNEQCRVESRTPLAEFTGGRRLMLPQTGFHTALNALAITALLEMLGFKTARVLEALERFDGVWRRQDLAGTAASGALVYDDYAHNPEKIVSCLRAMRELSTGDIYAVFQPHGFKPFGFMKDELYRKLEEELTRRDRFILLPPFYAGGSSSFKPTSEEVTAEWKAASRHPKSYQVFPERGPLADYLLLSTRPGDVIVIMGARDNSLSDFAASLVQ